MSCKWKSCIYPTWTKRPVWTIIDDDQFYP